MRAARIGAEQRAYAAWRDGRKGDIDADVEDTHAASGPTWAGDEPAGNLANPSIHCGPTPLWNAPTVNLPGGTEMRRKAAAGRATRGEHKEDKENELGGSGGNFAAWLERGERGYTRTPGDLREVYTVGDNANADRGNNQYARRHVDLLGARSVHPVASDVAPRTSAAEVSATAEEARWEEENRSRGCGLSNMASMRDAIKSASRASTERTTRSRSHLSSHVGVV